MRSMGLAGSLLLLPAFAVIVAPLQAQNFGILLQRKKIVLQRKLPPTGHVDGTTFKVLVTASGLQADLATDLKSTLESTLIRNDSRLRSEDGRADTVISCRITTYSQPQPIITTQPVAKIGKGPVQNQQMARVTGILTVSFTAKDGRSGGSLAGDTVTAKFDEEFTAAGAQQGVMHSVTSSMTKLTKGKPAEDKPPTAAELHNLLIQDAALQIASHLVNTTENVEVYLARGGGLDEADKLAEKKLYTRSLEQLETMQPFPSKDDDAYRLYDLGVINEALAYQAEDVQKARKFLQEASIDYGKAIDAKPTEKYFMQPQTRIDTALAHYKIISGQKAPVESSVSAKSTSTPSSTASSKTPRAASDGASGAVTNDQVISMVAAKMDEANIIDTIQHAPSVHFDLTVQGQVDLTKNGVNGRIITAMKARSRSGTTTRHTSGSS